MILLIKINTHLINYIFEKQRKLLPNWTGIMNADSEKERNPSRRHSDSNIKKLSTIQILTEKHSTCDKVEKLEHEIRRMETNEYLQVSNLIG